jgi:large subunit ribosomal protein L24
MDKQVYKIRLKKGDKVVVRSGKYKGQSGKVVETHPALNKVTVEGINIVKKHQKPNREYPQGGIIELTKPIAVGKVSLLDPTAKAGTDGKFKLSQASRIGFSVAKDGAKIRVLKKTGKEIK